MNLRARMFVLLSRPRLTVTLHTDPRDLRAGVSWHVDHDLWFTREDPITRETLFDGVGSLVTVRLCLPGVTVAIVAQHPRRDPE